MKDIQAVFLTTLHCEGSSYDAICSEAIPHIHTIVLSCCASHELSLLVLPLHGVAIRPPKLRSCHSLFKLSRSPTVTGLKYVKNNRARETRKKDQSQMHILLCEGYTTTQTHHNLPCFRYF